MDSQSPPTINSIVSLTVSEPSHPSCDSHSKCSNREVNGDDISPSPNRNIHHPEDSFTLSETPEHEKISTGGHLWSRASIAVKKPILTVLVRVAIKAARWPRVYVVCILATSIGLLVGGYMSNFRIETREASLWAPSGSPSDRHEKWIRTVYNNQGDVKEQENERRLAYNSAEHLLDTMQNPTAWFRNQNHQHMVGLDAPSTKIPTSIPFDVKLNERRRLQETSSSFFVSFVIHADGRSVVTLEGVRKNFEAIDRARSVAGYDSFCEVMGVRPCPGELDRSSCQAFGVPTGQNATRVCPIGGVSALWFHNASIFGHWIKSDFDLQKHLAIDFMPGEIAEFDMKNFIGYPEYDTLNGTKLVVSGTAYLTILQLPRASLKADATRIKNRMLEVLLDLKEEWIDDIDNIYRIEAMASGSFEEEFIRSIVTDLPLLPFVAFLMCGFTALVYFKFDWLHSQCLLGFGSVLCVTLSLLSGYGIMFICGVPFTSLTLALVYIVYGVGLDDSFIIYSAYYRTSPNQEFVERIRMTMNEVGISIFMTSLTTEIAFALGCQSAIPCIRWLCMYAFTTIAVDFLYQISFFVALVALDNDRIKQHRKDCCVCFMVTNPDDIPDNGNDELSHPYNSGISDSTHSNDSSVQKHFSGRIMSWYADKLLHPVVKSVVLLLFAAMFAVSIWRTLQLHLYFDFLSVLPSNSYVSSFYNSVGLYTNRQGPRPYIYFRDVDQSDPAIQAQMHAFVDDLVTIDAILEPPFHFWLRDYDDYVINNRAELKGISFNESVRLFLKQSSHNYNTDVIFDENGSIQASRTAIYMNDIAATKLSDGIKALKDQRTVATKQPINQNKDDWSFFTFDQIYLLWEFLLVIPAELTQSTLIGIGSVCAVSIIFIPHWSGFGLVTPMAVILYIDLMGFIQLCGLEINGLSYVSLVMAIGLLVDYVMHVVLRYYESSKEISRNDRVKYVLETMGASVLLGGCSTFLGIVPLMFSSSDVIRTFVISFAGVVVLGLSHGLVLMPVLLSMIGPYEQAIPTDSTFNVVSVKPD